MHNLVGWSGFGRQTGPKTQQRSPELCSPCDPWGTGENRHKSAMKLWDGKNLLVPTPLCPKTPFRHFSLVYVSDIYIYTYTYILFFCSGAAEAAERVADGFCFIESRGRGGGIGGEGRGGNRPRKISARAGG